MNALLLALQTNEIMGLHPVVFTLLVVLAVLAILWLIRHI